MVEEVNSNITIKCWSDTTIKYVYSIGNFLLDYLVPKTCNEYIQQGAVISGSYEIDPDGAGGGPPFLVQCDFENGQLKDINHHKNKERYIEVLKFLVTAFCSIQTFFNRFNNCWS